MQPVAGKADLPDLGGGVQYGQTARDPPHHGLWQTSPIAHCKVRGHALVPKAPDHDDALKKEMR
jgi:hypothetical protein